jgi:DNA-directed RNA polymerase specialized sigma24 family protein
MGGGEGVEGFAEFARGRHAALYRYAYLLAGERGLAEDLVQEALVKTYVAWRRQSRSARGSSPSTSTRRTSGASTGCTAGT